MSATAPQRNKWLQFVVLLLIGGLLTALAFAGQDLGEIWDRIVLAKWEWVGLSVVLTALGHLSRARRWQLLISGAGHEVAFWPCLMALMTGYLSNLGIPRIGELGRCASLARVGRVPLLALGGTVLAERAVDVVTLMLLAAATFVAAGERVLRFWAGEIAGPLQQLWSWRLGAAACAAALVLAVLGWWVFRRAGAPGSLLARAHAWARDLWDGMWSTLKMPRKGAFLLHTAFIWLAYYAAPLCTLMALGLAQDEVLAVAFYAFVFGSMARTLPLPAGSMGAYHYLISHLMLALGYSLVDGISLATLNHAVQTAFYLIFGCVGLIGFLVLERRMATASAE